MAKNRRKAVRSVQSFFSGDSVRFLIAGVGLTLLRRA